MKAPYYFLFLLLIFSACSSNDSALENINAPQGKAIYIPEELKSNDFQNTNSKWCYQRSASSENFIVFWEKGFGKAPSKTANESMRVDVDDLLDKAELFYKKNVDELKFVTPGSSNTDKYRMMIFLLYQDEWLATGSGYDDKIGALWINPSTCQPVGSVIAHEIGHCFQYQTYCDNPTSQCGYRYGFGNNGEGGNGFWEQCAQWQSFQSYHSEQFTSYDFPAYELNEHKHMLHEEPRYSNYFIMDYWCSKHGIDFMGKLWRNSKFPEDPIETYQRLTGISQDKFNDEIFDAASHFINWDIDAIREYGRYYRGRKQCTMNVDGDFYLISPNVCPENYGYNIISLSLPSSGREVIAFFDGLPGKDGYRKKNIDKAGWRYGFVAYLNDGTTQYGTMGKDMNGVLSFAVPSNCQKLYFVVSGAPTEHWHHAWDDNDTNDEQWPYRVKFTGTSIL